MIRLANTGCPPLEFKSDKFGKVYADQIGESNIEMAEAANSDCPGLIQIDLLSLYWNQHGLLVNGSWHSRQSRL